MFLLLLFQETLGVPEETAEDALKLVRENGPWVYELFAVLIHSGSALGGHYYAHIKSLGDGGKRQGAAAAFFFAFFCSKFRGSEDLHRSARHSRFPQRET